MKVSDALVMTAAALGIVLADSPAKSSPFFQFEPSLDPDTRLDLISAYAKGTRKGDLSGAALDEKIDFARYSLTATYRVRLRDASRRLWGRTQPSGARGADGYYAYASRDGRRTFHPGGWRYHLVEVVPNLLLSYGSTGCSVLSRDAADGQAWQSIDFWGDEDRPKTRWRTAWTLLAGGGVLAWPHSQEPLPGAGFVRWDGESWSRADTFHGLRPHDVSALRFFTATRFLAFGPKSVWIRDLEGAEPTSSHLDIKAVEEAFIFSNATSGTTTSFPIAPIFQPTLTDTEAVPFVAHRGVGEVRPNGQVWWLLEFGDDQKLRSRFHHSLQGDAGQRRADQVPMRNHLIRGLRWVKPGHSLGERSTTLFGHAPGRLRRLDLPVPEFGDRLLGAAADDRLYFSRDACFYSVDPDGVPDDPPAKVVRVPWPKRENGEQYNNGNSGTRVDLRFWIDSAGIPSRNLEYPLGRYGEDSFMVSPADVFGRPSHQWAEGGWIRKWGHVTRFIPEPRIDDDDPPWPLGEMDQVFRKIAHGGLEAALIANRKTFLESLRQPANSIDWGRSRFTRASPSALWFRYWDRGRHISWIVDAKGCHKLEVLGDFRIAEPSQDLIWLRLRDKPNWIGFKVAQSEDERSAIAHRLVCEPGDRGYRRWAVDKEGQVWSTPPASSAWNSDIRIRPLGVFPEPDFGQVRWDRHPFSVDSSGWFYLYDYGRLVIEARKGNVVRELELSNYFPSANLKPNDIFIARSPAADLIVICTRSVLLFASPPEDTKAPWRLLAAQVRDTVKLPKGFDASGNLWLAPDHRQRCDFMIPASVLADLAERRVGVAPPP